MGVSQKKNYLGQQISLSDYIQVQGHWGHKKNKMDPSSHYNFLGIKEEFCVINPEHSISYSNRTFQFCYKVVLSGGTIYFFNSGNENDESLKKMINYFALRSLQPTSNSWIIGGISNKLLKYKQFNILVLSSVSKNSFILRETSQKLIPVISVKDTNVMSNKLFQEILSNDDSKEVYYYYYYILSNVIIKAYLFKHAKTLISI